MEIAKTKILKFRQSPAFTGSMLFSVALLLNIIIQGPLNFFNPGNMNTLFMANTPFLLIVVAQSILLLSGTMDISIGIQLALVNVVAIMAPQELGVPIYVGWILGITASLLISLVMGFSCSVMRLPSMLVGYAMIFIIKGINVLIMDVPQGSVPKEYYKAYDSLLFGFIPVSLVIVTVVLIIASLAMQTKFGKHIYAVGGSPRNAYAAGISPVKVQMKAFLLKGLIVGIAGICLTLMTASGNPLQGENNGLTSLSAAIVGGLTFGGWGSISCGVFGAGFFVLIQNAVYYLFTLLYKIIPGFTVSSYWHNLISDIILLIGLMMTILTQKTQRRILKEGLMKQFRRGEEYESQ